MELELQNFGLPFSSHPGKLDTKTLIVYTSNAFYPKKQKISTKPTLKWKIVHR